MMRIDVAEKFARQDLPSGPTFQPPDYTALPTGKAQITGIISQEGLDKREADIEAVKHTLGQIHTQVFIRPKVGDHTIDVEEKFERQDLPSSPTFQPPDYIATPLGVKYPGLISQEGLHKRAEDVKALSRPIGWTPGTPEGMTAVQWEERQKLGVKTSYFHPSNQGIFAAFDKFFSWLNRLIGEK